ncbi:MAG: hypothetical protein K2I37_09195 [Muribaculaceae bacterium]|nr:hypothetical protein [Muribaculaceae bacterium]
MTKLLSMVGALLLSSGVMMGADAPQLYICGNFNDWQLPVDESAEYQLLDEDADGVYTGSFDFEAIADGLEFKVVVPGGDDFVWYGVYTTEILNLYSDAEWNNYLFAGNYANVAIPNWGGGRLEVKATPEVDGDGKVSHMTVELSCTTQPKAPVMPENIYAIGDFNDWRLPADGNDNGAVAIARAQGVGAAYWENLNIPAGTANIMFYYVEPDTGRGVYIGSTLPPFTLYRYALGAECRYMTGASREELNPFTLYNWLGTSIMASVSLTSQTANLAALDGVGFRSPTDGDFYAAVSIENAAGVSGAVFPVTTDQIYWNLKFDSSAINPEALQNATRVEVLFTTEDSLTPDAAKCWGEVGAYADGTDYNVSIAPSATPIVMTFSGQGYMPEFSITASLMVGMGKVTQSEELRVPDGVDGVAAEEGEVHYYTLQGVRVDRPTRGIYIRVADGRSRKVVY